MRSRAAAARHGAARHSAGQALLLAVIVMLLILLVGGLFVALVSFNQSGSARFAQATEADAAVRVGIDYADHELMYSPEGADWRPPAPDYGPDATPGTDDDDYAEFDVERGWTGYTKYRLTDSSYYLLTVTYQPGPPAYIVIDCIAVVEGETVPKYTRHIAYKALSLVSFGRHITDFNEDGDPAIMGVPSNAPSGSLLPPIQSRWGGWHYYNVPVLWLGMNDFTAVSAANYEIWAPQSGPAQAGGQVPPPAVLRTDDPAGQVSRIEAPDLNVRDPVTGEHRLRVATKESGWWIPGPSGSAYNTGEYGWGNGIYIDNSDDVQFVQGYRCPICGQLRVGAGGDPLMEPGPCTSSGCPGVATEDDQVRDLEKLRLNWLRAGKTTASDPEMDIGWNATREWYEPKDQYGRDAWVKITLYSTEAAANAAAAAAGAPWPIHQAGEPGILIERSPDGHNWILTDQSDSGVRAAMFDYPADGLIYAEGNVRIKGSLPPSSANRDYSLTVCSGATTYIDGNILTPENTLLGASTRVGLLAEDYVCVNATQIAPPTDVGAMDPAAVQEGDPADGWYWGINPGESVGVNFQFGIMPPPGQVSLVAKQCGADDSLVTNVSLKLNGTNYDFADRDLSAAPDQFYFQFLLGLAAPWISNSFHPQYELLANTPNPTVPWRLDDVVDGGGSNAFRRWGTVVGSGGAANSLALTNWGQSQYCLKRLKIEETIGGNPYAALHTSVNAAIYAQNGSFFIIPGTYFDPTTMGTADEARFGRYNYDIWVFGAISEEHPAPSSDAYQWMDKWSFPMGGTWFQPWVIYEPVLTTPNTVNANLPKLPRLPMGPGFVYVGQEKG